MIGLGSNRLTIARRGGMSVTQAGRGGMEWLAGGRMPDWVTPYSAQATAALKQNYSTYWNDIRLYGFERPEIVPYVNEDPDVIVSMVYCGVSRWLKNANKAYIDLTFTTTQDTSVEAYGIIDQWASDAGSMFSTGSSMGNGYHIWPNWRSYESLTYGYREDHGADKLPLNTKFKVSAQKNVMSYIFMDGSVYYSKTFDYHTFSYTTKLRLFGLNYNGTLYNNCSFLGGMDAIKIWDGDTLAFELYPFKRGGEVGLIDVLHDVFYTNDNTEGQFTISETPAS